MNELSRGPGVIEPEVVHVRLGESCGSTAPTPLRAQEPLPIGLSTASIAPDFARFTGLGYGSKAVVSSPTLSRSMYQIAGAGL